MIVVGVVEFDSDFVGVGFVHFDVYDFVDFDVVPGLILLV